MNQMHGFKRPGWLCIDFLAKTKRPMDEEAMRETVRYLVNKYESLRVKIHNKEGNWVQEVYPLSEAHPFVSYDLSSLDEPSRLKELRQVCIKERDDMLPWKGDPIRIIFFKFSPDEGRLWFLLHHIICDFVSILILTSEFMTVYNSIKQGRELKWKVDRDYRKWLYLIEGYTRDVMLPVEWGYWTSLPWDKTRMLPSDYPEKFHDDKIILNAISNKTILHTFRILFQGIDQDLTARLFSKCGADFENILVAVFFLAVARQKKMDWLDINVCNSGRNVLPPEYDVNVSRLLGFTAISRALLLRRPTCENILEDIRHVMEQIRKVPNGGIGYYLISDHIGNDQLRSFYFNLRQPGEIFFNYLGRVNTNFNYEQYETAEEDTGWGEHEEEFQNTLLACFVGLRENQLFIRINYTEEYFKPGTIEEIMQSIMTMLREIAEENIIEKVA